MSEKMTRRYTIAPSILTADLGHLADAIQEAEQAGVDAFHLDVMDGQFVPNITFGPLIVETIRKLTALPLDLHLMIVSPDRYVQAFVEAGATSVTVHQEVCWHLHRQIAQLKELGLRASVAINPATPLSAVEEVLPDLDMLLVMSVNPGFGGQSFIPRTVEKVRRARALLDACESTADLQVDGGVGTANIARLAAAGATSFVTGSAVYNRTQSVRDAVQALRNALSPDQVAAAQAEQGIKTT